MSSSVMPAISADSRRARSSVVFAGLFVLGLAIGGYLTSEVTGPDSQFASWVSEIGQLAAAGLATVASAVAVRRHAGPERRAWLLVTFACGSWLMGQLIWCYFVVVLDGDIPEVSIADPFFLLFTFLMAVAVWPSEGRQADRLRLSLDAFIIGMSLFTISWVTSINQLASSAHDTDLLGLIINLSYPCGDVVVLTMVLLGTSRRVDHRSSLAAVAVAMALIAVSDGLYAYLSSSGAFDSGSVAGLGWTAGFGLIGCAALASGYRQVLSSRSGPTLLATAPSSPPKARVASMLPYLPLGIALAVVAIDRFNNGTGRITGVLIVFIFIGVLVRQYLTIRDNATLTRHLESRERELHAQAFADQLTGLPNRALFTDRVTHALEQHRRTMRPLALLFVDLDDFKVVNDTLGHPVGDELVIGVAERFRGAIRASDTVARFGGDEFAVLVEGENAAVDVGTRLVECLRPPFSLGGEQLLISASIGVAEVKAELPTPPLDELYSRADIAMYAAKRSGKGKVALYEQSMVLPEAADLHYRPLLIDAIGAGDIECFFQPVVDLAAGRVYAMEALARWRVAGEMVDQKYFLKLAGRLGLFPELTDLMLEQACSQLADWTARLGCLDLHVGVNVPAELMNDHDFPRRVAGALHRHHLGENRILLEITEDALRGEIAVAGAVADRLRQSGVHLWLDDFGSGYSSLLSLRQIPLQAVKIDTAFVANIHTDPNAERFLGALLAMGRDLDLLVTAEGVECAAQAEILRSLGCQYVQGYLYARPAPAAELEHLLQPGTFTQETSKGTYSSASVF
jgi:diguanylate cyclase (GGDEF)-like protein